MSNDSSPCLPVLNDTNFCTWKSQILSYCMEYTLDEFLTTDKASLAKTSEQAKSWSNKKTSAADILDRYMGDVNLARFVNDDNRCLPHVLWKLICDHYESNSPQNQYQAYNDFFQIRFESTLSAFLTSINIAIANMRSVGMTIRVPLPSEPTVNENLLAEHIVSLLPSTMDETKEKLRGKRPLTLKIVRDYLDTKRLNSCASAPTNVKTETVLKAKIVYCRNGTHNSNLTTHTVNQCYSVHPELMPANLKRRLAEKKANMASAPENLLKAQSSGVLVPEVKFAECPMFLVSGCSDHMVPSQDCFYQYETMNSNVEIANGKTVPIVGSGFFYIRNQSGQVNCFQGYHVPALSQPLISIGRLFQHQCDMIRTSSNKFKMVDPSKGTILFDGVVRNSIFVIQGSIVKNHAKRDIQVPTY